MPKDILGRTLPIPPVGRRRMEGERSQLPSYYNPTSFLSWSQSRIGDPTQLHRPRFRGCSDLRAIATGVLDSLAEKRLEDEKAKILTASKDALYGIEV